MFQDDINRKEGKFIDSTLSKNVNMTGIKYLMLVYYEANPFAKEKTINGKKQISYGCRSDLYIQVINTTTNEILNSKHYSGSVGTAIMGEENIKTKEQALKESLENATPDFTDNFKSLDEYFRKTML